MHPQHYIFTFAPCPRPGAHDAYKLPSIVNGQRVAAKQRQPHPQAIKVPAC